MRLIAFGAIVGLCAVFGHADQSAWCTPLSVKNPACDVTINPACFSRKTNNTVVTLVAGRDGREGASYVAAHLASACSADGTTDAAVRSCLLPRDPSTQHRELVVDVSVRRLGTKCAPRVLAILTLAAHRVVIVDRDGITAGTLDVAETAARFAEVQSMSYAAADADADPSVLTLAVSGGTTSGGEAESATFARRHQRRLLLVANKIDTCELTDSAMKERRAEASALLKQSINDVRSRLQQRAENESAEGPAAPGNDDEDEDLVGLIQLFDASPVRAFFIRHGGLCGEPAVSADITGLRGALHQDVQSLGRPWHTLEELRDALVALAHHSEKSFPAIPRKWLAWVRGMTDAAVNDAIAFFTNALRAYTEGRFVVDHQRRNKVYLSVAAPQSATGAVDATSGSDVAAVVPFTTTSWEVVPGSSGESKIAIPSLEELDQAIVVLGSEAKKMVRRRLFSQVPSKALTQLARQLQDEATRSKREHKTDIQRRLQKFADECERYTSGSTQVATLPVSEATIDSWHKVHARLCDGAFHSDLGKFKAQLKKEYASIRADMKSRIANLREAKSAENGKKLKKVLAGDAQSAVAFAVEQHMTFSTVASQKSFEVRVRSARKTATAELKRLAGTTVGDWALSHDVFSVVARAMDSKLDKKVAQASAENSARLRTFGNEIMDTVLTKTKKSLGAIRLPVDPTTIDDRTEKRLHEASKDLRSRFEPSFSDAEIEPFRDALASGLQAERTRLRRVNTELWSNRMETVRDCAKGRVQDAIFDAPFYSPVRVFEFSVRWALQRAVQDCAAAHQQAGGDTIPDSVLADVTDHWLKHNHRFQQLINQTWWMQRAACGLILLLVFVRLVRPRQRQAAPARAAAAAATARFDQARAQYERDHRPRASPLWGPSAH